MAEMRYIVENVLLLVVCLYLYNAKLNFAEDLYLEHLANCSIL